MKALATLLFPVLLLAGGPAVAQLRDAAPPPTFEPSGRLAANLVASIVTFQPGTLYWQRFGHNALLLREPASGRAVTFNYGIFDFGAPDFFLNFAQGLMTYRVVANTLERDLRIYEAEQRWAVEQRLNLDALQVGRLRDFLEWNVRRENADYRYDYFTSNCSTRVRDALDYAIGGQLRPQLAGSPAAASYRREATRLIAPDALLMVGMDLALGPTADQPIDRWQQAFAPLSLMQSLRTATVIDSGGRTRALVAQEIRLLPGGRSEAPDAPPDLRLQFLLAGLMLAGLLLGLARYRAIAALRWLFMTIAGGTALLCAAGGAILAAMWALTDHWAGWRNVNLLLVNPLCLLLLPTLLRYPRLRWRPSRAVRGLAVTIAVLALLALLVRQVPALYQRNLQWIYLLLPIHVALAWVIVRAKPPIPKAGP